MEQALQDNARKHDENRQETLDSIPEVEALGTELLSPFEDVASSSSTTQSSTQSRRDGALKVKLQDQADKIRQLKGQLKDMEYALANSTQNQSELHAILRTAITTPGPKETPGPHRLQPRATRPEDIEFQEKVRQQTPAHPPPEVPNIEGLEFIEQLAKAISATNHLDITEPAKFTGQDQHWDEFYSQLRSYFAAKD